MTKNLNRRRLQFFNKFFFLYISFLLLIIILIYNLYLNKDYFLKNLETSVESFSKKYNYQYINLQINGLEKIDSNNIEKILNKYNNSSIFLLPFDKITKEIKENNWIKNIKLTTDYKNTLIIDLEEYKPIGLYNFNNKLFYFDNNGKIIEQVNNKDKIENYIIFYGNNSNLKANLILQILNDLNFQQKYKVKKVEYLNKRRWNIYLKSNMKLMLSETDPKISLQNFINIEKQLKKIDIKNINYFDLRNIDRTIIDYIQ